MNGSLRLTVLGTGYLGITHAACVASLGFDVLGVDTDACKRVKQLNTGIAARRSTKNSGRSGSR